MTRAHRIALYSPPICGLVLALGWCVVDRLLRPLGVSRSIHTPTRLGG